MIESFHYRERGGERPRDPHRRNPLGTTQEVHVYSGARGHNEMHCKNWPTRVTICSGRRSSDRNVGERWKWFFREQNRVGLEATCGEACSSVV